MAQQSIVASNTGLETAPAATRPSSCHPGEGDKETCMRYGHWGYRWAEELEALTAPETRRLLKEQKIALTSFARAQETGPALEF
jgi:hypothetical protein